MKKLNILIRIINKKMKTIYELNEKYEETNSSLKLISNPFKINFEEKQKIDEKEFLLKMENSLKSISLNEEEEIEEKYNGNYSDSSSFLDRKPLFTYSSEHSSDYEISDFEL